MVSLQPALQIRPSCSAASILRESSQRSTSSIKAHVSSFTAGKTGVRQAFPITRAVGRRLGFSIHRKNQFAEFFLINFWKSENKRRNKFFTRVEAAGSNRTDSKDEVIETKRNSSEEDSAVTPSSKFSSFPPSSQPTDVVVWGGTQPPTRRLLLGGLAGLTVILGGNLGGATSFLLNLSPEVSRSLQLDVLFPIQGFKRCVESGKGFGENCRPAEFVYPASWLGDQRLLYRAVERAERERSLDLPGLRSTAPKRSQRAQAVEPLVAYGPPGGQGELNVSVVVAPVAPGFVLENFGGPADVGERILTNVIAPKGSDRTAVLIAASRRGGDGLTYYALEYTVKGPSFYRHNVAVYTAVNNELYSLNAQSPEASWEGVAGSFHIIADSFQVKAQPSEKELHHPQRL